MKKILSFKIKPFSKESVSYIVIFINLIVSIFLFNTFIMIDIDNQVDSFYQQNYELFLRNDSLKLSSNLGKWIGQSRIKCLKGYSTSHYEQFYQYQIDKCNTSFFSRKRVLQKNENDSLKVEVILRSDSKVEIGMTLYLLLQSILLLAIRSISKKHLRIQLQNKHEFELKMNQEKIKSLNKINLIASQVSHDIRSPLAALNMIVNDLTEIPEKSRIIIRSSVNRINDIANQLLEKGKTKSAATEKNNIDGSEIKLSVELLSPLIDSLVSLKRVQFREKQGIEIEADINSGYGLFANINPTELHRTLSNLINNSAESFQQGKILVSIKAIEDKVILIVQDNGKGIPAHILAKLGEMGVSHGKEGTQSGSGLGIYHAKKTIESFGGKFEITSIENQGTTITMTFPKTLAPTRLTHQKQRRLS